MFMLGSSMRVSFLTKRWNSASRLRAQSSHDWQEHNSAKIPSFRPIFEALSIWAKISANLIPFQLWRNSKQNEARNIWPSPTPVLFAVIAETRSVSSSADWQCTRKKYMTAYVVIVHWLCGTTPCSAASKRNIPYTVRFSVVHGTLKKDWMAVFLASVSITNGCWMNLGTVRGYHAHHYSFNNRQHMRFAFVLFTLKLAFVQSFLGRYSFEQVQPRRTEGR